MRLATWGAAGSIASSGLSFCLPALCLSEGVRSLFTLVSLAIIAQNPPTFVFLKCLSHDTAEGCLVAEGSLCGQYSIKFNIRIKSL